MATPPNAARRIVSVDTSFLREQALRCSTLARDCPHLPTAHQLEAISAEFMLKATELDEALADWVATD